MKKYYSVLLIFSLIVMVSCQKNVLEDRDPLALKVSEKIASLGGRSSAADITDNFQIGVFWPPTYADVNDTTFSHLAQGNVDILQYVITYSEAENLFILDKSADHGLRSIIFDARAYGTDADIAAMVAAYETHPGLAGYYIKDEPNMPQLDWAATIYNKILSHDSFHLPHVNLFPDLVVPSILGPINYETDYVQAWINKVGASNLKYLSVDVYPFRADGSLLNAYYTNLDIIRKLAINNGGIKTSAYLQSIGITGHYRRPNADELKFNVYSMLAYGIKYPVWFTYFTPINQGEPFTNAVIDSLGNKTDLYTPFQQLNKEMKTLGDRLMRLQSYNVYHSGTSIPAGVEALPALHYIKPTDSSAELLISHMKDWSEGGRNYAMLVNKSLTLSKTYTFQIAGWITDMKEISKVDGSEIPISISGGTVTLTLQPGEGRLFAFLPY
ncbi:hypothetical protein FAZ15_14185 [Sphingobacterium olei]|uniref:Uncharacterized protein n=1 Tax=Sphingobacterium olei TaxID=2571155 RepID=A0A4U0NZ73_9SPHI|nr:hypothetical protein [Sphingobacterium olei]TJZ60030.1 hypothetical protein FAZ15_14185 [Sphingobacterium olei]